ncbi:MAG TPA: hypothetical protein VKN76_16900 [Kiloniellaceae bacterium]|nr:hypothetical protein [Kiloniellaceae bacterium]
MPEAEICINGASVKLSGNEISAEQLGKQALDLLREAAKLNPKGTGAIGFAHIERRGAWDAHESINTGGAR